MTEWQPIETVPRDGTPILIYSEKAEGRIPGNMAVDWWDKRYRGGFGKVHERFWPATHWKPLPEPPQ